ncbi:MAG: hypothetical protein Q8942_16945 [Bacillota bacterium]|nr:hypothetical protein [Bacillota bacterium]
MKKHIFLSVFIIMIFAFSQGCSLNQNTELELKCDDIIPSGIRLFNVSGKSNTIDQIKGIYKVIFYLDDTSDDCVKRLDCITKMIHIINFKGLSYAILWENEIPIEKIQSAKIDLNYNYCLKGKASLSESKPTAFLTDKNNKVMTVTGYSYVALINQIIELSGKKDFSNNAGEMILKNIRKSGAFRENGNKTLLMFISSGCRKCKEDEDKVQKNIAFIQNKINVIAVRPDFDVKQKYDKYFEMDPQQIYFNIFAYAKNIGAESRKYPMFVIINDTYGIENLFTDVDEMVNYVSGL